MPPIFTRAFGLLVTGHFLQALGYASMLLLPLYLHELQATRTEIGTIMAISSATGLVFRPAVGWAIDTIGRRPTITAGTLLMVCGMGLIYFVVDLGPLVYVSRLVVGIGEGALFTGYFVLAADIIPEKRRTEGLALFGISGLVPIVIGPAADYAGIAPMDLRWFLPLVAVAVAASLPAVWAVPEPPKPEVHQPLRLGEVLRALVHPGLWPVWLATSVFATLVAIFMAFATVAAESRGLSNPAGLWFAYAGGAVAVRTVGARVPDRLGPSNLVAPAIGFYCAAMLTAAEASSTAGFLLVGGLAGFGHGYSFPVLSSQVVTRSPVRLRGSALAMFTALWALTALVLTPVFGAVSDRWDDATMFALAAVFGAVGLAGWGVLEHRVPRDL